MISTACSSGWHVFVPRRTGLVAHRADNAAVAAFVADHNNDTADPIVPVDWIREDAVGGLLAIQERGGPTRWEAVGGRADGHQLAEVALDGATHTIAHDALGRVTQGAGASFVYDPRGRLVHTTLAAHQEVYAYDAQGRLAQVVNGKTTTLAWDGDQIIAGFAPDGVRWDLVPGVATDHILEFEHHEPALEGRYVAIADHRNSIVGWWDADALIDPVNFWDPYGLAGNFLAGWKRERALDI